MATVTFSDETFQLGAGTIPSAWLPLSTAWPKVAACSTQIYAQRGGLGGNMIAFDPLFGESIIPLTASEVPCLPPQVTSSWYQSNSGVTTILGPIFQCPSAYTAAQTVVMNSLTQQIFCCPSDYAFNVPITDHGVFPSQCISKLSLGQTLTYESTTPSGPWGIATTTLPSTPVASSGVTIVYAMHVNGFNILAPSSSISDTASATRSLTSPLTLQTTSGQTSSVSLPTAASNAASFAALSTTSPTNQNTSKSLSNAATAGIGVGVTAIVLLGLSAACFMYWQYRKRRHWQNRISPNSSGDSLRRYEMGEVLPARMNDMKIDIPRKSDEVRELPTTMWHDRTAHEMLA